VNALILNDPFLDSLFGRGFPLGKMIHIYGRSGTCKSTFALQVSARFGALGKKAFFIDTTTSFNKKRFSEIAGKNKKIFDHILLASPSNLWEQTMLIDTISKFGKNISLVCVDTISAFLRPLPIIEQKKLRNIRLLTYQLAALSQLCKQNNCNIILINQATIKDFNRKEEVPVAARFIDRYSNLSIHFTRESERYRDLRVIGFSDFEKKSCFYVDKKGLLMLNHFK